MKSISIRNSSITHRIFACSLAVCLLLNSSCSTLSKVTYLENIDSSLLQDVSYTSADVNNARDRIQSLRTKIKSYTGELDEKDYDEIITALTPIVAEYRKYSSASNAANKTNGTIVIPAKTRLTLNLNTYCLSPHAAAPSHDEPFVLVNKIPDIPLYKEIMQYTNTKDQTGQNLKQNLFWNLKNEVMFEDLPREQQTLLLKIDPAAYLKVNNRIKELAKNWFEKFLNKYLPGIGKVKDAIEIVKGKVYSYQDYTRRIENLQSKYRKPASDKPIKSEGYDIYTQVRASGFSHATVTFVNITDREQEINSYFKPLRKDVQTLGFDIPDIEKGYNEYRKEFLSLSAELLGKIGYIGPGDIKTIDENPNKLILILKAYLDRKNAFNMTQNKFGYSGTDDASDAFRHTYWNAIMIRDIGYELTEEITSNHELNPDDDKSSVDMDIHNNRIGREIGIKLKEKGITDNEAYAKEVLLNMDKLMILVKKGLK